MALDEPKESDSIYEVEGTKILFDRESAEYTNGLTIDLRESIFGKRLMISQLYGSGGCR